MRLSVRESGVDSHALTVLEQDMKSSLFTRTESDALGLTLKKWEANLSQLLHLTLRRAAGALLTGSLL